MFTSRLLMLASITLLAPTLDARSYTMDAATSKLGFVATQQGEAFNGRFARFTPTINFDPADLTTASIDVEIDVTSVGTDNEERDAALATPEFFDFQAFPKARFKATNFRADGEGFVADGQLTIRDQTVAVPFVFRFVDSGNSATLKAVVAIDRMAFGVGTGDWADPSTIAHEVKVEVDLLLKP